MNTVTSAFHAQRALIQLVKDHGSDFPLAANFILNQSYVDDLLSGADTLHTALELICELAERLSIAGFQLRKWTSNKPELLENFPTDHLENPHAFSDESSNIKILGLQWSPSSDVFLYSVTLSNFAITKRQILSNTARTFELLQFLTSVILWANCFVKKLCITSLTWDQPLPEELATQWTSFSSQLCQLTSICIPRFMGTVRIACHILGFCDASKQGMMPSFTFTSLSTIKHQFKF